MESTVEAGQLRWLRNTAATDRKLVKVDALTGVTHANGSPMWSFSYPNGAVEKRSEHWLDQWTRPYWLQVDDALRLWSGEDYLLNTVRLGPGGPEFNYHRYQQQRGVGDLVDLRDLEASYPAEEWKR